jgi:hypothetical protein
MRPKSFHYIFFIDKSTSLITLYYLTFSTYIQLFIRVTKKCLDAVGVACQLFKRTRSFIPPPPKKKAPIYTPVKIQNYMHIYIYIYIYINVVIFLITEMGEKIFRTECTNYANIVPWYDPQSVPPSYHRSQVELHHIWFSPYYNSQPILINNWRNMGR